MNYLAHIFLSGSDCRVQLGNFMGDAVKGGAYREYPQAVADGILLHRAIDTYTDNHPAIKAAIQTLRPHFGRYSAVLLDVYFDYLLASRFGEFSDVPLRRFAWRFYRTMILNRRRMPARIRRFMWHFIGTDRLCRYATPEGIRESLGIMAAYGRIRISPDDAADYLVANEDGLRAIFMPFFGELQGFCTGYFAAADRAEYLELYRNLPSVGNII